MTKKELIKAVNRLKRRYFLLYKTTQYIANKNYRKNEQLTKQELIIEDSILGSIMLKPRIFIRTYEFLLDETIFHNPKNQIIYEITVELFNMSEPMDTKTIINRLKKHGSLENIGGEKYVTELHKKALTKDNIDFLELKF